MPRRYKSDRHRIEENVTVQPDGCWTWGLARTGGGYGVVGQTMAHRFSYEVFVGPIPDGLTLDHLCENPPCVNPDHLEPVTLAENLRRSHRSPRLSRNQAKTHCPKGHPYDEANTGIHGQTGQRICRPCHRARNNARYAARRVG